MADDLKRSLESAKRDKLRREKPLVLDKLLRYPEKQARGEPCSRIDIAYDYICDLKCKHCMISRFEKKARKFTPADIRSVSEQADALGLAQFNISGGEPLLFKELDAIIAAMQPERFHIGISTNGHFLTADRARHLKSIGLDKVMISLDSIDPALHEENRGKLGTYDKAKASLFAARDAGLDVIVQHVVSHQNAQTDNTVALAKFAQDNGFSLDLVLAKPLGEWEGRHDVLIDDADAEFLWQLHQQYPAARRDTFPSYGLKRGCGALEGCFHITKFGDVLPCVFMHIGIGNVFTEPLKDIIDRGMSIKWFRGSPTKCLAGENREFIDKYMSKFWGKPVPVDYREVFAASDFVGGT